MTDNPFNPENFILTADSLTLDYIEEKNKKTYYKILECIDKYYIEEVDSKFTLDNKIYNLIFKNFYSKLKFIYKFTNLYKNKTVLITNIYDSQIGNSNLFYINNKSESWYDNTVKLYYLFDNNDINLALFIMKYPKVEILR
jgi:hypothetical protein